MNAITRWIVRHDRADGQNYAAFAAIGGVTVVALTPIFTIARLLGWA